ncbi:hypothetical protein Acr_11g0007430 [Actinidia rufa]|uniref:Uncharacterized protein n=1 Tax=Actinidia rufa TaxID=165716 RepID=A0A7J0FEW2_9ERIC|nr:hypothetical protein Acr_11g0007430 [Actinidia rufa]
MGLSTVIGAGLFSWLVGIRNGVTLFWSMGYSKGGIWHWTINRWGCLESGAGSGPRAVDIEVEEWARFVLAEVVGCLGVERLLVWSSGLLAFGHFLSLSFPILLSLGSMGLDHGFGLGGIGDDVAALAVAAGYP